MKQFLTTALLVVIGLSAQAQTSETRKSENFTTLDVKNGIEVVFTQSDAPSLKVESDNIKTLENIVTEFSKGSLKVYMRDNENKGPVLGVAKVYVSAAHVKNFKAVTGATIKANGKITGEELSVKLASGASFTGELNSSKKCIIKAESGSMFRGIVKTVEFEGKTTSGSTIKITGNADITKVACNNGSLIAGKFLSQNADIKTTNGSTAFVNAIKSISADADNSSSITYYGEPAEVNLGNNMYAIKRDNLKLALNN
ncbi:GIN domain-containing protein [Flavobacterium suzhouense]|uniref:GIN domain-containing protein n=1 Tax=Flavobacterium suzhouense TaxID=1529638 RepID=A0ABW5NQX4_9FLAO